MSSIAPSLAVSGDVGILADENAQRLVSIFSEAVTACLQELREMVEIRLKGSPGFQIQYAKGLASIRNFSSEVLQGEIARLEAKYPETRKLHQFVFINTLSEAAYAQTIPSLVVPPMAETYHCFLKRVISSSDVQRGQSFFDAPLFQRRVVFLDAFRNAFHDVARRCASAAEAAPPMVLPRPQHSDGSRRSQSSEDESKPTRSRLAQAMAFARAPASEPEAKAPEAQEKAEPGAPDDKKVTLLDTPAFFEEEP